MPGWWNSVSLFSPVPEFEVNIVVLLHDDHLITENFPLKLCRMWTPTAEAGRIFWEFLRGKVELYPCLTSAGTTSIPSSWGHILCFHLPVNLVRTLPSLAFPILLPSTKPFPIFLRQILKESFSNFVQLLEVWSKFLSWFHFIILVPKALKTP